MNIKILLTFLFFAVPVAAVCGQQQQERVWQKKLSETLAIENVEEANQAILTEESRLKNLDDTFSQRCLAELLIRAKLPRTQGMAKAQVAKRAIGVLETVIKKEPENVLALYLHARTCAGLPPIFGTADAVTRSYQSLFEIEKRKPGSVPYPDVFASLMKIRQNQANEALKVGLHSFPNNPDLRTLEESHKAKEKKEPQSKEPQTPHKPTDDKTSQDQEHVSKAAFRNAMLNGKMDFEQLDRGLATGELAHPGDHEYPLFRGLLRLWQLEIDRDGGIVGEAVNQFRQAMDMNPEDTRIFGWIGPLLFVTGQTIEDKKMMAEGQRFMDEGVRTDPEQNLFARAFAYDVTGTQPKLLEEDLYRVLEVCTEGPFDRSRYLAGKRNNDHCACGDVPTAPYNLSGTHFWAGEVFRRAGDKQRAKDGYENALKKDPNKTWPFRELAEARIKLLDNPRIVAKPNPVSCMLCHQSKQEPSAAEPLEHGFQEKLDALFRENEDAVGVIVHVEFPDKSISWTSAVGFSDKAKTTPLDGEQPVLIASNTKTYVAASILRLVEMECLELDRSLEKSLTKETNRLLAEAGYDIEKLTIKHLLSHTSGIQDYVDDAYFERVKKDPKHQWKKQDQVLLSTNKGQPLFAPGEKFSYGDINYLLLTEIIERETEQAFYVAMRELLKFDELNINNTWFKNLEPIPTGSKPLAHQYAEIYEWDSYNLNPSWDLYGGGGLASTAKDAALFYQYLFEGKIIKDEDLLKSMSTYVLPAEQSKYCLGLFRFSFATDLYYHGGWWGTDVAYSPDANATVAIFTLEKAKRDVFGLYARELLESLAEVSNKTVEVENTADYELHKVENSKSLLVLFPGGGTTSKETKEEFKVLSAAAKNSVSVLFMNFNRHFWLDENEADQLAKQIELVTRKHGINTDNVYVGGMSIGGNVALSLSNHLLKTKSSVAPKGVFIVDAPIDLYALYESSQKDIANPNFSEERLAEPKWIINFFEESFGKGDNLLRNIQKKSPFTQKSNTNSVSLLQGVQMRMYTEPDAAWWKENRQTDFESTNAFCIQEIAKQLIENDWQTLESVETKNKGYRANGERHPHSWSIVDIPELIDWINR